VNEEEPERDRARRRRRRRGRRRRRKRRRKVFSEPRRKPGGRRRKRERFFDGNYPKDVNRSSVIAKHVHRWYPVAVASQALTRQTVGRYTLWVLGFVENRLGNALNANP